ncbi:MULTISPECIES: aldo/keto reductase [Chryseobacterium]|uniref:Aryl-alcohol dehydrogenase-like predicted oxidoreductase n=1 Tax=Chryseobacterium camelliae TaxID=1265445 RepID=A0ABU0TE82_9FLAO|nr:MULTISPECIES: aldo/keto reductase [Chryseobacterium]MDT3406827.1 aryl-alcohol dehydrogenase-like predicted oxidoreductase [Pseudacidovorax intermedius]MDQ1095377.1 aryl-alcohol dehydrogenase-like predicted oxidoreductase [Chryseobacterium camelliae]MDQ1099315.1 aryl-alcohol dehydrogenase-like predicted oxidoreductase [Chryseobacterium sp. SORGH_AS_1048]MDR6086664.1 aryl-alcohol dehydrogenase-like predicted oxidoreductase [Chryseobacterium sp. SORGH_AS_0909]MDR6131036.1 aryl-alcohol dehydrog
MKTRQLGTQGLEISLIGLGCMGMSPSVGFNTYGKADEKESIATIHRSLELGGNFLDTADLYGPLTNERLVGNAIKGNRDKYIIATKFGFEIDDNDQVTWRINGRPDYVKKAVERSLKNLQTDVIDLYYMHRPDPEVPIEETVGAMAELVKEGKIKYIGISEVTENLIRRANKTYPITAVQNEYSLFERSAEEDGVYQATRELGIGMVAYSPLGRGFLTGQIKTPDDFDADDFRRSIPRFQGEQFYKNIELVEELQMLAVEKSITETQLSIAWVIAKGVTPIPGTKRVQYIEQNIAATEVVLSKEDMERIERIIPLGTNTGDRNILQSF